MSIPRILVLACFGSFLPFPVPTKVIADYRPNFVIFFTDDQGYNDVGCFGSPLIETPRLDRMAAEGLKLTSFYVQPVCGVSRAALLTGSYPIRVGEPDNRKNLHTILHPDEVTLPEILRDAGYATGMIGKWHLAGGGRGDSWKRELLPNAQGFDYWFGAPSHNGTTRIVPEGRGHTELMRNGEMVDPMVNQEEMGQLTKLYTEEAVSFLRRQSAEKPFFLYLAHTMPHVPVNASEEFLGKSKRGLYGDVIEELDWSMGQILDELKTLGFAENTLVIFTSDNGPWIEDHLEGEGGTDSHCGSADPLRGAKMMTWEGGIRVPTIAWWPGQIDAGRESDEVVASIDFLPTFASLAGVSIPEIGPIDGVDQSAFLKGEADSSARDHFFYYAGTHLHGVRWEKWKLVLPRVEKPGHLGWWARMIDEVPEVTLYDLDNDIEETTNVATEHPEVVARMEKMIEEARADLGDFDRIGTGARFHDEPAPTERIPAKAKPKSMAKKKVVSQHDGVAPIGDLRFDFEAGELEGWTVVEGSLEQPVSSAASLPNFRDRPFNRHGKYHLSTVATKEDKGATDTQIATLRSPRFVVAGERVTFLLSGGGPRAFARLLEAESGAELGRTEGPSGPQMKRMSFSVAPEFRGEELVIELVDGATRSWGHLCFDDFSAEGKLVEP
ncbi:MAG: sulfatase [Verrucomicrobiota bacterium]